MTKHILIAALLAAATTALAQPSPSPQPAPTPAPAPAGSDAPPTADKKAEAKALYEQGLSHYNLGEFDEAIKAFRAAYAIEPAPGLLFNIAQSFRLKKDYEQATYFYQTYLRLKPDAPNRPDVEARLQEMQEALAEQKKMQSAPPIGTVPPEGGSASTPTTTTATSTTPAVTVDKTAVATDDGKNQTFITAGYATAGAGAALLLTGLIFGEMAKSNESDLNGLSTNMGMWSQANQDKYDAGKRDNTIAVISFVAGGAAVATGAALYLFGTMHKSSTSVAVTPTTHGTALAVGWSF